MKSIMLLLVVFMIARPLALYDAIWEHEILAEAHWLRTETACSTVADCGSSDYWQCLPTGFCQHKNLFPPLGAEYGGFIAQFCLLTFANMAGVGGGGLVIPFVILFNGFNAKQVAQQAPFYNLVSALIWYLINIPKKSPVWPERTLIDYDMVAIFVPLNLFGANIGGVINVIFPNFIVDVCLFLFLLFVIYKLF